MSTRLEEKVYELHDNKVVKQDTVGDDNIFNERVWHMQRWIQALEDMRTTYSTLSEFQRSATISLSSFLFL